MRISHDARWEDVGTRRISRPNELTLVGAFVTVALAPAVVAVGLTVGFLVPLTLPDAVGVIVRAKRLSARKRVGFIFML